MTSIYFYNVLDNRIDFFDKKLTIHGNHGYKDKHKFLAINVCYREFIFHQTSIKDRENYY